MTKLTAAGRTIRRVLFLATLLITTGAGAQLRADFTLDRSGGCSPLTVSFTNRTTGASASAQYRWDLGNGNTSVLQNPGAVYREEKSYTVTLTVTDGGQSSSKSATVTVYKKPTADFTVGAAKVCLPASASFTSTASAGDGSINSYHWDFGDGQTGQGWGGQMSHYYHYEQKPTVTLTVTNSYGCYSSVTKPGMLEILPPINVAFRAEKALLCNLEESVQLRNTSTGPGTLKYAWDFGDGKTSTAKEPSHQYTTKGVHPVRLTVSNTDGCSVTGGPIQVNAAYFNTDFTSRPLCREVSFNSSSFLSPSASLWQFGDGTTSTSYSSASHVYATAGTYTATLINTYDGRCKDTVTKTIKVEDNVRYNSAIEAPENVCVGSYVTFTSKSATPSSATLWEFPNGVTYGWQGQVSHMFQTPGTYTIKLTNTFGTCKETVIKNITVHALPEPKGFIVDYGGVCGSPVTVQFKDTTPGAVAWAWKVDYYWGQPFATTKNTSYRFNGDGYYSVHLTVTNAAGCSQSVVKPVNIFRPSVTINPTYSSSTRGAYDCDSLRMTFDTWTNQPLKTYSWNFGDGSPTSTETTPTHTFKKIGRFVVTLNYTTESGCTGSANYTVQVYDKPKADFTYYVPCGNSLNLEFREVAAFSDNWSWEFGDGKTGYGPAPLNLYPDTGQYTVKFITHIGHCSDTTEKVIHANVLPSFVRITKGERSCEGTYGTVVFDQSSLRIERGTWDFGDGTTMPYDTSVHRIVHTYTRSGTFTVKLTGTSGACTLLDSRVLTILLKQNPTLSANKTEICANDNLGVQISNLIVNPYTGNSEWGQYYVTKFVYDNGTEYTGYLGNYWDTWKYTNYSSTLQGFPAGATKMRAIVAPYNSAYITCPDTTNFINLKVNGPIAGFKTVSTGECYKSAFVFQDTSKSSTNTPLSRWQWDFGDGTTTTTTTAGARVEHRYANPGVYPVRLTVTDATGCTATFSQQVTAKGPKASFTGYGLYYPNVPLNTTVTFYNNTNYWYSNSVAYQWQYGDGATSTGYTGQHQYTRAGVDTVVLIATDASISCADTVKQVVTVKDFNTAFAFTTAYLGAGTCPPVTVQINNLSVGYTRLRWDFGDGTTIENVAYPSHTYNQPGTYRITLYTYGYNNLTGTYIDSVVVKEPSATFSANVLQGCTSQSVTLQAAAKNTTSYFWDMGDGTIIPAQDNTATTHNFVTPGIYKPRLVIKDDRGCTTSTELADRIIIDSLRIAIKGIPPLVCDAATIQFAPEVGSLSADRLQEPLAYQWDFGTGNAADVSTERAPAFRYSKPGTYTVRFRVESKYGCVKETTQTFTVQQTAKGSITGAAAVCEGGSVQFTGTASISGSLQWQWAFGNGATATAQQVPAQVYPTPGTFDVQMIVNNNGCYDTSYHRLTVNARPSVNLTPQDQLVCRGKSVQLSAGGGGTYAWTPATGLSNAALANPLATPLVTTKYTVQVTSPQGCTNSDSITLTVAQPIDVRATADTFLCAGSSVQLTASGATSYRWIGTSAGLNNTAIANPVAAPAATTLYQVVGYDAHNCFTDTVPVRISVFPLPTVNAGPDAEITGGVPYQLSATASPDVTAWSWTPATNLSCSNCPAPLATPRMQTEYTVQVRTAQGCTASDNVVLKLQCAPEHIHIPDAFTPNKDGKNDVFYPLGSGVNVVKYLRIFNRWGEMVFERTNFGIHDRAAGWDGTFKGLPAPAGTYVYFTEMECSTGQLFTRKGTVTLFY